MPGGHAHDDAVLAVRSVPGIERHRDELAFDELHVVLVFGQQRTLDHDMPAAVFPLGAGGHLLLFLGLRLGRARPAAGDAFLGRVQIGLPGPELHRAGGAAAHEMRLLGAFRRLCRELQRHRVAEGFQRPRNHVVGLDIGIVAADLADIAHVEFLVLVVGGVGEGIVPFQQEGDIAAVLEGPHGYQFDAGVLPAWRGDDLAREPHIHRFGLGPAGVAGAFRQIPVDLPHLQNLVGGRLMLQRFDEVRQIPAFLFVKRLHE